MPTSTIPGYTGNTANNLDASASLAASATRNFNWDISSKFGGWVHVDNTPGGTVSATRGLRIDVYRRYGSTPTTAATPLLTYTMPSATISTLESLDFFLAGPNKYNIKITNLDAAQAITTGTTGDTFDDLETT